MSENIPSYSIAVPVFVLADRDISPTAKLLYGVIDSFLKRTGVCYATNSRLAEEMAGCGERTISRCVAELKDAGYINVGLASRAKDKKLRRITLNVSVEDGQGVDKNGDIPSPKLATPLANIGDIVLQEVIEKENKKEKAEKVFDPLPLFVDWIGKLDASKDEKVALYKALLRQVENRKVLKKPYKSKQAVSALCNRLLEHSGGQIQQMIDMLDRAVDNGWQSIYPEQSSRGAGKSGASEGRVYEQW